MTSDDNDEDKRKYKDKDKDKMTKRPNICHIFENDILKDINYDHDTYFSLMPQR